MKKLIAVLMTILFLGSTGMVLADVAAAGSGGGAGKVRHNHKKGGKKKPKNTLNPQPLPPRQAPPESSKDGAKTAN